MALDSKSFMTRFNDRLVPETSKALLSPTKRKPQKRQDPEKEEADAAYDAVLQAELLGNDILRPKTPVKSPSRILQYCSPTRQSNKTPIHSPSHSSYATTPLTQSAQQVLRSPRRKTRPIARTPYKVLDAPDMPDDYYLNLVDWGNNNILTVGLGSCVYLWQASTGKVTKLCDAGVSVTSVQWADTRDNPTLAVGLENGYIQLWDASKCAMIRAFAGHKERVSSFAWNASMVSSGSRDRTIRHWDSRSATMAGSRLTAHTQEVCGLKWNVQEQLLASGGNDNRLCIWSGLNPSPLYEFTEHRAAVKALAWSPHHSSTLASGGGTIDRCIRIWNAKTGLCLNKVDTGSQVCNLAWSRTSSEIVSTHGYSHNQIVVWKYPSMHPMATLTGHTSRVLYLACGPDNESIVTGAADETLRFWKVFTPNETRTLGSTLRAQDIR